MPLLTAARAKTNRAGRIILLLPTVAVVLQLHAEDEEGVATDAEERTHTEPRHRHRRVSATRSRLHDSHRTGRHSHEVTFFIIVWRFVRRRQTFFNGSVKRISGQEIPPC